MISQTRFEDYLLSIVSAANEPVLNDVVRSLENWSKQCSRNQWSELEAAINKRRSQLAGNKPPPPAQRQAVLNFDQMPPPEGFV